MPKSSRHKSSHKQRKHSPRDSREYSESEEDAKMKDKSGKEKSTVRVSRDSCTGEKRKLKDHSVHANGDVAEEHSALKRRKDRDGVAGSDSRLDSERSSKSKVSSDSKRKSSRRNESGSEKKEESKSRKAEAKRDDVKEKDKDSGRKEVSRYKEKERDSERDGNLRDRRHEPEMRVRDGDAKKKKGSQSLDGEGRDVKQAAENTEWPLQDGHNNPELEKELEKRIRRRGDGSVKKDKYLDDIREDDDRQLSSRGEHASEGRYKVERHSDGNYRENIDGDSRHRESKQRDDVGRDKRHREDKHRDERASRRDGKFDSKHTRDESNAVESRKKSRTQNSNRDRSPIYDDRNTRSKDDMRKRRSDDKEDQSDIRSRSTKEQCSDAEKKSMNNGKVESLSDRGMSRSRGDVDPHTSHDKRSSPSTNSHVGKEQYRHLKQVESKYRDSMTDDGVCGSAISSKEVTGASGVSEKASVSQAMDKVIQDGDSNLGELLGERCLNSDARTSPMQLGENFASRKNTDYKHLAGPAVTRSVDAEESGQWTSGIKDAKDLSGNGGNGIRELPLETPPVDDFSQADGDIISASSPYCRTSHLPSKSRSLFPPRPPYRAEVDSPYGFGSLEENNRGKSNYHYKRTGDFNMGRALGNAWKGVPNWSSSVTNGFVPFQHGPPPLGFHPVMQQFSASPMFGIRPSMELNHGVPYHISDADRYSSHGHTFGLQNTMDESRPPPLHGWEANNGVLGGEAHIHGRHEWDCNRTLLTGRGWESMWDGQSGGMTVEMSSASWKENHSLCAPVDGILRGQSSEKVHNEQNHGQNQPEIQAENIGIGQSSDTFTKETSKVLKPAIEPTHHLSKLSRNDDARRWLVYLSKLDISADLTHPDLYNQCISLMDGEENKKIDEDSKLLHLEGVIEARVKISNNTSSASLFAAINDSVFQRAMSFYKKQREETRAIFLPSLSNLEKVSLYSVENFESSDDDKSGELVPTCYGQEAEGVVSFSKQEKSETPNSLQKRDAPLATPYEKADEPVPANSLEGLEEPSSTWHATAKMETDMVCNQERENGTLDDQFVTIQKLSLSATDTPAYIEGLNRASNSRADHSVNSTEEEELVDNECGHLLSPDMSSEAYERVMSESIESGSVNFSRIHHSPESTR